MFTKNKTLPFLWRFTKKYSFSLSFSLLMVIVGDQLNLIASNVILQKFINEATNGILTIKNGIIYGLLYLFCFNFVMFIVVLNKKIKFPAVYKLKEDIKNFIFQHSLKQSNSFFNGNFVGSLNSKINDITNGVQIAIDKIFDIITNMSGFLSISLLFMIKYRILGIVFVSLNIIYFIIFYFLAKKIKLSSEETSKKESESSGKIIDCFTNISNIKTFSTEKIEKANIKKQSLIILKNRSKVQFLKGSLDLLNAIYRTILIGSIFFINCYLLLNNKIAIGDFVANLTMVGTVFWWLNWAMMCFMDAIEAYGKINQAVETLFINPEIVNSPNATELLVKKADINFKGVDFRYNKDLPFVFENLNLKINSHQKVGLVGYSGSGKSTLISLLVRFYDLSKGEILIDNQNIETEITQESLRHNICYVPQDPILFHRTIKENVIYGRFDATEEEIIEATKKACCYDFILKLEDGFDTLVGERGIKLSGGQRQRIAIARAILKNSPILILDEATSALDSLTEQDIQIALKNLMENKTVIAVAHRLSTLNNMDRIVVLNKGIIVEDGTKNEVLNIKNGLFKRMWEMQKDGVIGK